MFDNNFSERNLRKVKTGRKCLAVSDKKVDIGCIVPY